MTTEKIKTPCVGNYFKCIVSKHYNPKRQEIVNSVAYRRLRRQSCKGECAANGVRPLHDVFEEDMGDDPTVLVLPEIPIHNKIYELVYVPLSTDPDTSDVNAWMWELKEVPTKS